MRRDNLTTSRPILFTASICCYGHSEIPEQSLSSKYFCIIVLHDCVPKQQRPPPKAMTAFHLLTLRCIFQEVGVCDIYHLRYYRNCCFNDVQFDNIEYLVKKQTKRQQK